MTTKAKPRPTALARREVTIAIPTTAEEVAILQRQAESDLPDIVSIRVDDAESYEFADALLTDRVRKRDAAVTMRKEATSPMYAAARVVERWFKPYVGALDDAIAHLKRELGAYRVAQREAEIAARELVARAAEREDPAAMIDAVQLAADISASPEGRATCAFLWSVKRIAADLLPDEWWSPDLDRIAKFANEHPGDGDAPIIPGVIFERVARIGAKR